MRNSLSFIILFMLSMAICQHTAAAPKKDKKQKKSEKKQEAKAGDDDSPEVSSEEVRNQRVFLEAIRLKLLGDYQGAAHEFESLLKISPNNDAAHFELARLFYSIKADDKAFSHIEAAVKQKPDNIWYNLVYAEILSTMEKYKEAVAVYDKIVTIQPKEMTYMYDKAFLEEKSGMLSQAINTYDKVEAVTGTDDYLANQKKRVYLLQGKVDKAADEIKKLIDVFPNETKYYAALAEMYASNNQKEKAFQAYDDLLKKFPDDPVGLLAMADHYYQSGDKSKAISYTERAFLNRNLDIDTKVKILYQYIQFAEAKKNEMPDAYRLGAALEKTHPEEAKAYAICGDLYFVNKNDSAALWHYNKSLKLRSDIYTVWQQVLFINSDLHETDELMKRANEAIELFPNQALPYFFKGVALYQNDQYKAAIGPYQKALKISSDNKTLRGQILANLGDTYHQLDMHESSDSCYEMAIKLEPDNAYALNNYAYYLSLRKNKLEKAKEYSLLSNNMEKNNPSYMDTYAWILYQLGEYQQAKEWQMRAIDQSSEKSAVMLEHYGDILFKLGTKDDAVKYWEQAKQAGSDSKLLDKKIHDRNLYEE
jgi:tetratricopeptide (TPR) repeat protein